MNIATVIVNWNKKNDVLDLLTDLAGVKSPSFDVFVVDNASTDGSPAAIRSGFPGVNLIINTENLGGTGGFNTGIDTILKRGGYDYIWLLDNDAKIKNDTLIELVNAMKTDERIGMVGSHVKDIENREMTVELGANFRWDIMGTTPVSRNTATAMEELVEVDYVAICSALLDVNAVKRVGLMDQRLFLFWDDMDWGVCFQDHGYKVVAAPRSIVYHASFTERERGPVTNFYYGLRNPLLVYTKHTNFFRRSSIFYNSLRYSIKAFFFLRKHYKKYEAGLMHQAFSDFIHNRWGKFAPVNVLHNPGHQVSEKADTYDDHCKKILISFNGLNAPQCRKIAESLNQHYPESDITVLVPNDRIEYFKNYRTYVLDRTKSHNLSYLIKLAVAIKRQKFDAIASVTSTPIVYLGKRSILLNKEGEILSNTRHNPLSLIILPFWICYSELIALIILPLLLYKSLQYNK